MRQTTFVFILLCIAFCLGWHFAPEQCVIHRDCEDATPAPTKYKGVGH